MVATSINEKLGGDSFLLRTMDINDLEATSRARTFGGDAIQFYLFKLLHLPGW